MYCKTEHAPIFSFIRSSNTTGNYFIKSFTELVLDNDSKLIIITWSVSEKLLILAGVNNPRRSRPP